MDYLTIKQAMETTGRSLPTIRRLITRLSNDNPDAVRKDGKGRWEIRADCLPVDISHEQSPDSSEAMQMSSQMIDILRGQLEAKDREIERLHEQLRASNDQIRALSVMLQQANAGKPGIIGRLSQIIFKKEG